MDVVKKKLNSRKKKKHNRNFKEKEKQIKDTTIYIWKCQNYIDKMWTQK